MRNGKTPLFAIRRGIAALLTRITKENRVLSYGEAISHPDVERCQHETRMRAVSAKKILKLVVIALLLAGAFWTWRIGLENYLRDSFITEFRDVATDYRRAVFEKYYDKMGTNTLLDLLEEAYPLCHGEAHNLGKVTLARTKDLGASLELCRDRCTGGCFHGVLMELLVTSFATTSLSQDERPTPHAPGVPDRHITLDDVKEKVNEICEGQSVQSIYPNGNCAHGMGHALTYLSGYDLTNGLASCGSFSDARLQFYCHGGVFMEYDLELGRRPPQGASPHFPCNEYPDYAAECYPYAMKYLARRVGTTEKVKGECLSLTGFTRRGCLRGYGFYFIDQVSENPSRLTLVCDFADTNDRFACIDGALSKLSDVDNSRAAAACRSLENPFDRRFCDTIVRLKNYSLEKHEAFSLYFPYVAPDPS